MSRLIGLSLSILMCLALLGFAASPTLAANDTADTAATLTAQNPSASDQLVGNSGGRYRYYRFSSTPGAEVRIDMSWRPGPSATGLAAGCKVYGDAGFVRDCVIASTTGDVGVSNVTFTSLTASSYLIQVFNYVQGLPIDFTVSVKGATAGVAGSSAPSQAGGAPGGAPATPNPTAGTLVGQRSGAFAKFDVNYPGANSPMTITLTYGPASQVTTDEFGFDVYDDDKLVGSGTQQTWTSAVATQQLIVSTQVPGVLTIQVHNYSDGVAVNYAVKVDGQAPAPVAVSGNNSPDRAVTLTPAQPGATGTLAGDSAGSYAFFNFQYQGQGENVYIAVSYRPGRMVVGPQSVGFNVYFGDANVLTSIISDGKTPETGVAYGTLNTGTAGTYYVQLYNYAPGTSVSYTIYVTGLK